MDLQYFGLSCFRLRTRTATLVTDPFPTRKVGISYPGLEADGVISTFDYDPSKVKISKSREESQLDLVEIKEPGEYEIGGIFVRAFENPSFHVIDCEDVSICYLGMLKGDISSEAFEEVGDIDYLIAPVGNGIDLVDWKNLEKLINEIDPAVLIPSCYFMKGMKDPWKNLKSVEDFVKEFGVSAPQRENKLKLKYFPDIDGKQLNVVILEPKGK